MNAVYPWKMLPSNYPMASAVVVVVDGEGLLFFVDPDIPKASSLT